MAQHYQVDVSLNANSVEVGIPSPQTVNVTIPLVGPAGPAGATGATGATGAPGQGVAAGGTTGQVLAKKSNANYDTEWVAAGAGSGTVTSVAISGSDGIEIDSGSPITSSGTIALGVNAATLRSHLNVADGAEANVQSNWTEADSGSDAFILNKPTSFTPSAHASTHHTGGTDALTPTNISAQWSQVTSNLTVSGTTLLSSGRNRKIIISNFVPATIQLPSTGNEVGDIVTLFGSALTSGIPIQIPSGPTWVTDVTLNLGESYTYVSAGSGWTRQAIDTHTHPSSAISDSTSTGRSVLTAADASAARTAISAAPASHTHTAADINSQTAANGTVLTANGSGGSSFTALPASGITAVGASTADVFSVSSNELVADDPNGDRIVFYDDSESKLRYLEAGSGLSISGTTLTATASGGSKTYAVFTALDNQPPSTAFATLDTRNSIAVLDFDDATDESAVFVGIIPEGASLGSGLKIRLHWMATTATSNNCVWDVSLERMTTDLDSDSFDTIASATAAANGTSGILTVTEITLTTIDSVTAGDGFRLKVTRDANNGSDNMSGDAELVAVEVRSAA